MKHIKEFRIFEGIKNQEINKLTAADLKIIDEVSSFDILFKKDFCFRCHHGYQGIGMYSPWKEIKKNFTYKNSPEGFVLDIRSFFVVDESTLKFTTRYKGEINIDCDSDFILDLYSEYWDKTQEPSKKEMKGWYAGYGKKIIPEPTYDNIEDQLEKGYEVIQIEPNKTPSNYYANDYTEVIEKVFISTPNVITLEIFSVPDFEDSFVFLADTIIPKDLLLESIYINGNPELSKEYYTSILEYIGNFDAENISFVASKLGYKSLQDYINAEPAEAAINLKNSWSAIKKKYPDLKFPEEYKDEIENMSGLKDLGF